MKKKAVAILIAFIVLDATAMCSAQPQRGTTSRGGARRGGFGGFQSTPPGPPAPVPPEVAIARPSEEEVATINAELQKFVQNSMSPNKDLLKKYASLLVVNVPRENPCICPTAARGGRHESFVETANTGDFDIIFYGDSITDLWNVADDGQGNPGGNCRGWH